MRKRFVLLFLLLVLLGATSPFGALHACYDIHCEYRPVCENSGGGSIHYQDRICQSSCGYWYDAGTCCALRYPTPCP
jgi:hypothetical protein